MLKWEGELGRVRGKGQKRKKIKEGKNGNEFLYINRRKAVQGRIGV